MSREKSEQKIIDHELTRKILTGDLANIDISSVDEKGRNALMISSLLKAEYVNYFLELGVDINARDSEGNTALMLLVSNKRHSLDVISFLLLQGANPSLRNNQGKKASDLTDSDELKKILYVSEMDNNKINNENITEIMLASMESTRKLKLALRKGGDVNARDSEGKTALYYAIRNLGNVKILLDSGADTNIETEEGANILIFAMINMPKTFKYFVKNRVAIGLTEKTLSKCLIYAVQHKPKFVDYLIKQGANINYSDQECDPALIIAIRHQPSLVTKLIEYGADKNSLDRHGNTALINAAAKDHEIVDFLLSLNVKKNKKGIKGYTALIMSVLSNPSSVYSLINSGAKLDIQDDEGNTALIYAIRSSNFQLAYALFEAGANVNKKSKDGTYTLHYAIINMLNMPEFINYIIERADVNVRGKDGMTPLMCAASICADPQILISLLKKGADVNAQDNDGWTALMLADALESNVVKDMMQEGDDGQKLVGLRGLGSRKSEVVTTLLRAGANPNITAKDGTSAIKTAIQADDYNKLKLLTQGKKDISRYDLTDRGGKSYFFPLIFKNKYEILELLLKKKANHFVKEEITGYTPLIYAAQLGYIESVDLLLKYGAVLFECDNEGYNVFDYASGKAKFLVIQESVDRGEDILDSDLEQRYLIILESLFNKLEVMDYNSNKILELKKNMVRIALDSNSSLIFNYLVGIKDNKIGDIKEFAEFILYNRQYNVFRKLIKDHYEELNFPKLHLAAMNENVDVVNLYIDNKNNLDVQSLEHFIPPVIHIACAMRNDLLIERLIQNGSNIFTTDFENKTALTIYLEANEIDFSNSFDTNIFTDVGDDVEIGEVKLEILKQFIEKYKENSADAKEEDIKGLFLAFKFLAQNEIQDSDLFRDLFEIIANFKSKYIDDFVKIAIDSNNDFILSEILRFVNLSENIEVNVQIHDVCIEALKYGFSNNKFDLLGDILILIKEIENFNESLVDLALSVKNLESLKYLINNGGTDINNEDIVKIISFLSVQNNFNNDIVEEVIGALSGLYSDDLEVVGNLASYLLFYTGNSEHKENISYDLLPDFFLKTEIINNFSLNMPKYEDLLNFLIDSQKLEEIWLLDNFLLFDSDMQIKLFGYAFLNFDVGNILELIERIEDVEVFNNSLSDGTTYLYRALKTDFKQLGKGSSGKEETIDSNILVLKSMLDKGFRSFSNKEIDIEGELASLFQAEDEDLLRLLLDCNYDDSIDKTSLLLLCLAYNKNINDNRKYSLLNGFDLGDLREKMHEIFKGEEFLIFNIEKIIEEGDKNIKFVAESNIYEDETLFIYNGVEVQKSDLEEVMSISQKSKLYVFFPEEIKGGQGEYKLPEQINYSVRKKGNTGVKEIDNGMFEFKFANKEYRLYGKLYDFDRTRVVIFDMNLEEHLEKTARASKILSDVANRIDGKISSNELAQDVLGVFAAGVEAGASGEELVRDRS